MSRGRVSGPQERAHVPWPGVRVPGASPCPVAGCQGPRSEPVSVMATVDGASAFTGLAPSMFYRRSWNMMRLTGRGLGGSSELLEVRVVPGSLSVFLR